MRQPYDFRINPKPISSEEIARHKDFDALLEIHGSGEKRKGIVQMRHVMYVGASLAAAAIALLLIFRVPASPGDTQLEQAAWEKQLIVTPPIPGLKPEFASLQVQAAQESTLGSNPRFIIPKMAFLDDRGNPVEGEVAVYFRKLDDFVDFFLAGIKLTHDSAAVKRQLESAGMVEIYAEQNGKRVYLAPGKVVSVEFESEVQFASTSRMPVFYEYYLDEEAGAWINQGLSQTEMLGKAAPDENDPLYKEKMKLYSELTAIEQKAAQDAAQWAMANPAPVPPAKPQKSNPDQPTLELDFLTNAVPETTNGEEAQLYKGAIWQISPQSPSYDQRAFAVTWQSARLRQINGDDFELILSHGANSLRLIVNPVLTGSAYEKAMETYRAAYAEYERALQQWKESSDSALAATRQNQEKEKVAVIKTWEKQWAATGTPQLRAKFRHRMEIDRMGLWTVARPLPSPVTMVAGRITDQHENTYDQRIAYVVNPEQNTLHQIMISGNSRIPIAPGSMLWAVTPEGKIAVLRPRELQQAVSKVTSAPLVLDLQEQQPASKEALKKMLQL